MNCVKMASNRVVILIDGICYANGTWQELQENPDPKVRQFFE
jgi:phospholipid/cholesterol/gamma-HCH transport system ATP-binding protein